MSEDTELMTKDEFCDRFVAELLRIVGPTYLDADTGEAVSTATYAEQTAPTYWDEPWQREEGPEVCAATDYSYWED